MSSRTVPLGDVEPARSRHAGRRSAVALAGDLAVVGTADGAVQAVEGTTGDERWRTDTAVEDTAVVAAVPFQDGVAVGERGPDGTVRYYDAASGERRWRYPTARDLGEPQKPSRFFRPFVVSLAAGDGYLYAAARRYERDGDDRRFESVVYAFDREGEVAWRYGTDASPIGLAHRDGTLAVAYNRCPGDHQHGLVVLDGETGTERFRWDPAGDGERRVGDVSFCREGIAAASHADYCGYLLDWEGGVAWQHELATPTQVGDETLYAYPNHVHASDAGVVFVTGNTYPTEGREAEGRHPNEHTISGFTLAGDCTWSSSAGGFANGIGTDGAWLVVPGAQHFRDRDAAVHGLRHVHAAQGETARVETEGIVAAAALDGERVAAVEEPVVYHDEGVEHGSYRLHLGAVGDRSVASPATNPSPPPW